MKKRYEDGVVPQLNKEIRTEFAKQMREIRLRQNLTQQVLADRVGRNQIFPAWRVEDTIRR